MIKKYRTGYLGKDFIEEVEVLRETEKCVYIKTPRLKKEQRVNKITECECYHDSFPEAKAHLIERQKQKIATGKVRIESLENQIDCAEKLIIKIEKLVEVEA